MLLVLVFLLKWVKSVIECWLYKFHLSGRLSQQNCDDKSLIFCLMRQRHQQEVLTTHFGYHNVRHPLQRYTLFDVN